MAKQGGNEDIVVTIGLDDKNYKVVLNDVINQATVAGKKIEKGFGGNITTSLLNVTKSLAKWGTIAAGAGAAVVGVQMHIIDRNAKMADSFDLSTEAFAKMRRVFEESGSSVEGLGASLATMQRNLINATAGANDQSRALSALGLNVNNLLRESPDQAFAKIAEAIMKIENSAQRTTTATQIFGKGAKELLPVMRDYADKAKDAAEFNDKFGISLSRVDAAKVEQANDAMGRVKSAIGGIAGIVGVQLAPAIEAVAKKIVGLDFNKEKFAQGVANVMDETAIFIDAVRMGVDEGKIALLGLEIAATKVFIKIAELRQKAALFVADQKRGMNNIIEAVTGSRPLDDTVGTGGLKSQNEQKAHMEAVQKEIDKLKAGLGDPASSAFTALQQARIESQQQAAKTAEAVKSSGDAAVTSMNAVNGAMERQKSLLEGLGMTTQEYKQSLSDLDLLYRSGQISLQQYTEAMDKLRMKMLETDKSASAGLERGLLRIKDEFSNVGQLVEDSFVDAFKGAEDALVEFAMTGKLKLGDLFKQIEADLIRIQIRQSITLPLAEMMQGMAGGGGGGFFSEIASGIGGFFSSIFGGGKSGGGPVNAGGSYIVGESGPERLFMGQNSGYIAPNRGGSGGVQINQTIINNSAKAQVKTQQSRDSSGNVDLRVMIDDLVGGLLADPNSESTRGLQNRTALQPSLIRRS